MERQSYLHHEPKAQIMDESAVHRAVKRISHEICERNNGVDSVCLIGIKRRGIPLAVSIQKNIQEIENITVPVGEIDITFYRDDLSKIAEIPSASGAKVDFDITGKTIVLVDDVIFTGRTVRAAIDALFTLGRPSKVQLAVLIDRGHRELPVRPDYVGKNIPTSAKEMVAVNLPEYDGQTSVNLFEL